MSSSAEKWLKNQWRNNNNFKENSKALMIQVYSKLDDAYKRHKQIIKSAGYSREALQRATSTFARYASLRTPPNIGSDKLYISQTEFEKVYYRPVLFLPLLVKGKLGNWPATQDDVNALHDGFRYKVLDTRKSTPKTLCYTRTQSEALEQARIIYRGLNRAAWRNEHPSNWCKACQSAH